MTCMKQEFCIHEKYCQRHIGQNFDSCILFSRNSKPMTNEEWLRSATFEELAGAIYEWHTKGYARGRLEVDLNPITEVVEWLKQPHGVENLKGQERKNAE